MNKVRANIANDELTPLREQLAALEKRIAALEAANAGVAAALGATKVSDAKGNTTTFAPKGTTELEKIPWLVISAAVAAVIKKPFRITGIEMQGLPPLNIWAFEGRRAIFYSHAVRPN